MEEQVGIFWHKILGNLLNKDKPSKDELINRTVYLENNKRKMLIFFRSMASTSQLQIEASYSRKINTKRSFLQKISGEQNLVSSSWIEDGTLFLPEQINLFSSYELNLKLYQWVIAMAAMGHQYQYQSTEVDENYWFCRNQALTLKIIEDFPGLKSIYYQLLDNLLLLRPPVKSLSESASQQENIILNALHHPGSETQLIKTNSVFHPVALWLIQPLHHLGDSSSANPVPEDTDDKPSPKTKPQKQQKKSKRKQAERVDMPDGKTGLITVRMENIFSWSEYLKVDRTTDDDDDPNANKTAEDMEHLSLARDKANPASKINFNLDLPAAAYDDTVLSDGILYPEWHYKKQEMIEHQSRIIPMLSKDACECELPKHLHHSARKVSRIFEALTPARKWYRGEFDGSELDLDAFIQFNTDLNQKKAHSEQGLYRQFRTGHRDLSTLLLADLSLSTDTSINNDHKIIDVIRESLFLFSEALSHTGDRFALYGFSSRKKEHVRFNHIKSFNEKLTAKIRGRIQAIKPGYYTRLGAAIRHSTFLLEQESAEKRILLILTDGKPNDLDHYEGRYGIEDTRQAIMEAKNKGLHPFCFTIDKEGSEYLPHIFGPNGYTIIRKPEELPAKLPLLYAELTQTA